MQAPLPGARAFSSASSSLGNPMLPPISPSSQPPSQAALTAHLSDLQHQVGTKSLALQTLQAEHNHLLSAYSRSQTRCGTLEKKFQVSDTEINNLTEERNRLQLQCDAFEKQVEDLLEQRDTANKLSIANGGQYTSILQQASRLEMQSLSDRKKWRLEKEEWERQKEEMEQRIKQLESEKAEGFAGSRKPHAEDSSELFHKSRSPSAGGLPEHRTDILKLTVVPGDIILSANPDDLRHEIIRLRHKANDLDRTLQELKTEGQRIDQMINGIGTISKRIFAKVDAATTSTTSPGGASTTTADSTQH
jgi:chromosome segregation ATPase